MLFHLAVVEALRSKDLPTLTWSRFYGRWRDDPKEWKELASSYQLWSTVKSPEEFADFVRDHPQFGFLIKDKRKRPRIIHAIKKIEKNIFHGITLEAFHSDPIEFEIKKSFFSNIKLNPITVTPTPTEQSEKQKEKEMTSEKNDDEEEDDESEGEENELTNLDLNNNDDPNTPVPAQKWSDLSNRFPAAPKINSLVAIHPILMSSLLHQNELSKQTTIPILQEFFNSTLESAEPLTRTRNFTHSLFLTVSSLATFIEAENGSRVSLESSLQGNQGYAYIIQLVPEGMRPTTKDAPKPPEPVIDLTKVPIIELNNDSPQNQNNSSVDNQDNVGTNNNSSGFTGNNNTYNNNNPDIANNSNTANNWNATNWNTNNSNNVNAIGNQPPNTQFTNIPQTNSTIQQPSFPGTNMYQPTHQAYTQFQPNQPPAYMQHPFQHQPQTQSVNPIFNPVPTTWNQNNQDLANPLINPPGNLFQSPLVQPQGPPTQQYQQNNTTQWPTESNNFSALNSLLNFMSTNNNSDEKKSISAVLTPKVKILWCRIAAVQPNGPEVASPCPSCMNILQNLSSSRNAQYVHDALGEAGARGSWQLGNLTTLLIDGPLWASTNDPAGLTFSAIIPYPGQISKESQKAIATSTSTSLKSIWKNNLAQDDIDLMIKKDHFFPASIHEFEIQLFTYIAMVGILAGRDSFLYQRLCSWIGHYQANYSCYYEQGNEKPMFLTRVLYSIDLQVQKQLRLLADSNVAMPNMSWKPITDGFEKRMDEITDRNFTVSIPESIIQIKTVSGKKRKANDTETKTEKSYSEKSSTRPTNSSPSNNSSNSSPGLQNKRWNDDWKVPANKTFKECYVDNELIKETPKYNGKPFCLQFHIRGTCSRGSKCPLVHDDPRDVRLDLKFNQFVNRANSDSAKKTKSQASDNDNN